MTFTNPDLDRCFVEPATGPVTVYVVSRFGEGIGGARFRLVPDPGLHWQYVGESVPDFGFWINAITGNSVDGIVLEGAWSDGPVVLLAVEYLATSIPEPCARLRIESYPGAPSGTAEVRLSDDQWIVPLFVHDLAAKPCDAPWCELSTPVRTSTWGAIKALYQ
jgi:hypothetical protein